MARTEQFVAKNGLNMNGAGSTQVPNMIVEAAGAVAAAGNSQATSTQLGSLEVVTVTSATAGSAQGVALIQSVPGIDQTVVNATGVPITVYGVQGGSDTINGQASVVQPAYSIVEYTCGAAGSWVALNLGTGYSTSSSIPTTSSKDAVSAAGTTSATAFQITTQMTRVTVNGGSPAGVTLPPAFPGYSGIVLMNASATPLVIYGAGSDQINHSGATAATYSLAAGQTAQFFTTVAGTWHVSVSA